MSLYPGVVVCGPLVPRRGEWYWSGEQAVYKDFPEAHEAKIRKETLERCSSIAYRYCPDEAAKALEWARKEHAECRAGSDHGAS